MQIKINGQTISLAAPEPFLSILRREKIYFPLYCGGRGTCGKYRIRITEGSLPITTEDRQFFSEDELKAGYRLGCRAVVTASCAITFEKIQREDAFYVPPVQHAEPSVRELFHRSHVVEAYGVKPDKDSRLPDKESLSIAVDIGSTTLVMALVYTDSGKIVTEYRGLNHQRSYGTDVMARIKAAVEDGQEQAMQALIRQDLAEGIVPEVAKGEKEAIRVVGAHNIIFLAAIVVAVILSGILPSTKVFGGGIHIFGEVKLTYAAIIEVVIILAAAFLSFKTTNKSVREDNHFSWGAIQEVAVLFIGIFITMIPALLILKAKGAELGLTEPWQMFWVTGAMSSFLDNTPTYLVFLTTAGTLGATAGLQTSVGIVPQIMLEAISCGAVFMGANTYIGNAPNFMVKSIAEENGIRMPSFFGYMTWSLRFLIPVFIIDMLIFFL